MELHEAPGCYPGHVPSCGCVMLALPFLGWWQQCRPQQAGLCCLHPQRRQLCTPGSGSSHCCPTALPGHRARTEGLLWLLGTLGLPVWHLARSHACWWVPTEGPSLGEGWGLSMEAGTPTSLPLARAAPWVLQRREPHSCSGSCRAPTGWGNQHWDRVLRGHTRAPLLSSPTVHSPGYRMV